MVWFPMERCRSVGRRQKNSVDYGPAVVLVSLRLTRTLSKTAAAWAATMSVIVPCVVTTAVQSRRNCRRRRLVVGALFVRRSDALLPAESIHQPTLSSSGPVL